MPYPKFDLDGFIYVIENTLPFLLLIAFLAMNINVVRAVVTEKEKRIKVDIAYLIRQLTALEQSAFFRSWAAGCKTFFCSPASKKLIVQ